MQTTASRISNILVYLAIALMAISFAAPTIIAQDADKAAQEQLFSVTEITVKGGQLMDFKKMMKDVLNPAFVKGGGTEMGVWEIVVGKGSKIVITVPLPNYAAMDSPSHLVRGLGDKAPEFFQKATGMIDSFHSYVVKTKPEMSYRAQASTPPNIAVVLHLTIQPEKEMEFEKFVANDYLPVVLKAGTEGFWFSKIQFGGNANEYIALELWKNFAELDKGNPVKRVLSPSDAKQLFDKMPDGVLHKLTIEIARYNPELSIAPAAATSN